MHAFGQAFENGLTWRLSVTPMSHVEPKYIEGGKIICPAQVLSTISTPSSNALQSEKMEKQRVFGTNPVSDLTLIHRAAKHEVVYPILFKISSETQTLFCGPVDWTAEPGRVYVPDWMMVSLGVEANSKITISVTELPTGYFVKFKPQSVSFLTKLTNPAAILERKLRDYAALKAGEVIYFRHVNSDFYLEVLEIQPTSHGAICIIEANLKVEFAAPDGYVEPTASPASTGSANIGGGYGGQFAMDEDDAATGEVDDLGLGSDSDSDDNAAAKSKQKTSSKSSTTAAFSGAGHRPSGKAVNKLLEPSLPDLASSPSGRRFITASGSLVIGPPPESSSSSSSANTNQSSSISAATASSAASSSSTSKNTAKPSVNNPVEDAKKDEEEKKFVPFSGAGHRLK